MSKRTTSPSNFIKAYFVNLLLQFEWLLLAIILLGLHFWKGISIVWFGAVLGFWLLLSLVITWFVVWATGCGGTIQGPGAKRNSERLCMAECADVSQEQKT